MTTAGASTPTPCAENAAAMSLTRPPSPSVSSPVPVHAVVYAKDVVRIASFYEQVLALARIESAANWVALAGSGYELSVVAVPAEVAARIEIEEPPARREETPLKLSFLVDRIESLRAVVRTAGGSLSPADRTWSWRGQAHLDGVDPEGNVFQLRQAGR